MVSANLRCRNPLNGGFTKIQILNYDADFDWSTQLSSGSALIGPHGLLTVTGLADGASVTVTVNNERAGYFDGTNTIAGEALDTELTPAFGTPIPGNRSFEIPITNYDANFTWTPSASVGTAVVDVSGKPSGGGSLGSTSVEESTVTLVTTRTGYLRGTNSKTGESDVGGQLDPIFGTTTATDDGLIADITNYDPAFTWAATSSHGDAEVVEGEGDDAGNVVPLVKRPGGDPVTVIATRR